MPGMHMRQLLGPDLFERNLGYIQGALRGEVQTFERAIQRPDSGRIRHSLAHYLPDVVDGQVSGFYVLVHDVTELTESRQRLDVALRESEALLQTIHMHSIYSVADIAGNIIDVNEAFCRISGFERHELIGKNHRLVNSGTHPASFWSHMWGTIASGQPWRGEICNRAKDGSLYWVDSVIAPFVGPNGRIEKFVSLRTDVTGTKLAIQALVSERERLDNIITGTNVGTWEWDVQSGDVRFNERSAQIMGYSLAEISPVTINMWAEHCHPDDLGRTRTQLRKHFTGELPDFECEARMRHKAGHWVWVLNRGRVLRWDDTNRAQWMIGTYLDITERKLAQERLRATSEAFLERAGQVAGVGCWEIDLESDEMIMTTQTRQIFEFPRDHSLTLDDAMGYCVKEARSVLRAAVKSAIEQGKGWDLELPFLTATGRPIWVRVVGEPDRESFQPGKGAGRLIGALQDVSAQHATQEALQEAKRAAEAASSAKSEFLANMSHEIRTPLNAVIGLSYLLDETWLNPEQRQFVGKIQSASRSLLGVINNVLDLSKIEAGELCVEQLPFDPVAMVRDLSELFGSHASDKPIEFVVDCPSDLPPCLVGDALRLRQVLINLLGNAFKFTDEGRVTLSVAVAEKHEQQLVLEFTVRDTGMGMSPEVQARLFAPFMQADASTTRRYGGTGLGLSIVHRLAALMGGDVGVRSQEGQGSDFWFKVPLRIASEDEHLPEQSLGRTVGRQPNPDHPQGLWLPGVRVLVVDDSDINRDVAQKILQREGAEVMQAGDGQEALDCLAQATQAVDVVLMDVQMPQMDGHEACRRLRLMPGLQHLPVIALTAGALVSERQKAQDAGMTDFVSKPFDPLALIHTLRRHVRPVPVDMVQPLREAAVAEAPLPWPELAGIDREMAQDRLGDDLALLAAMLDRLLREFGDMGTQTGATDVHEPSGLAARLHKLRGSAGMLGAQHLHDVASRAEASCRRGDAGLELEAALAQLAPVLAQLSADRDQLQALLNEHAIPGGRVDHPAWGAAERARLLALLRSHDLAAVTVLKAQEQAMAEALGLARFQPLKQAVMNLAFDEAQALLQD
jgi:PAS domain S-box-containing protein